MGLENDQKPQGGFQRLDVPFDRAFFQADTRSIELQAAAVK